MAMFIRIYHGPLGQGLGVAKKADGDHGDWKFSLFFALII